MPEFRRVVPLTLGAGTALGVAAWALTGDWRWAVPPRSAAR